MKQTDLTLIGYINRYGCFYMCIAYWLTLQVRKIKVGWKQLNTWWMFALETMDDNGRAYNHWRGHERLMATWTTSTSY